MKKILILTLLDLMVGALALLGAVSNIYYSWYVYSAFTLVYTVLVYWYFFKRQEKSIWFFPLSHVVCFLVCLPIIQIVGSHEQPSGYVDFSVVFLPGFQFLVLLWWLVPAVISSGVYEITMRLRKLKRKVMPECHETNKSE